MYSEREPHLLIARPEGYLVRRVARAVEAAAQRARARAHHAPHRQAGAVDRLEEARVARKGQEAA